MQPFFVVIAVAILVSACDVCVSTAHVALSINAFGIAVGGSVIKDVGTPTAPGDAANRLYIDARVAGLVRRMERVYDCAGVFLGGAEYDACGVCNGIRTAIYGVNSPEEMWITVDPLPSAPGAWYERTESLGNAMNAAMIRDSRVDSSLWWSWSTPLYCTSDESPGDDIFTLAQARAEARMTFSPTWFASGNDAVLARDLWSIGPESFETWTEWAAAPRTFTVQLWSSWAAMRSMLVAPTVSAYGPRAATRETRGTGVIGPPYNGTLYSNVLTTGLCGAYDGSVSGGVRVGRRDAFQNTGAPAPAWLSAATVAADSTDNNTYALSLTFSHFCDALHGHAVADPAPHTHLQVVLFLSRTVFTGATVVRDNTRAFVTPLYACAAEAAAAGLKVSGVEWKPLIFFDGAGSEQYDRPGWAPLEPNVIEAFTTRLYMEYVAEAMGWYLNETAIYLVGAGSRLLDITGCLAPDEWTGFWDPSCPMSEPLARDAFGAPNGIATEYWTGLRANGDSPLGSPDAFYTCEIFVSDSPGESGLVGNGGSVPGPYRFKFGTESCDQELPVVCMGLGWDIVPHLSPII